MTTSQLASTSATDQEGGRPVLIMGKYLRMSKAEVLENGERDTQGVTRQSEDCDKRAAELGVVIGPTYNDNNISAADPNVVRPEFKRMLKDLESGVIDGIIFYHADRLARRLSDAGRVTDIYEKNPRLKGWSVMGGTDLSTDEGRMTFGIQATVGNMEVAGTKRRVKRKTIDSARQGKTAGGSVPFGWQEDRKTVDPKVAALIRKAYRDIIAGKKIGTISKEWMDAGIHTVPRKKGGPVRPLQYNSTVKRLVNPRLCGYRSFVENAGENPNPWLPDHLLKDKGKQVIGDWEPIVTPDEWRAVVGILEKRRGKAEDGSTAETRKAEANRKYLLSGLVRCGECMSVMYGGPYREGSREAEKHGYRYSCVKGNGGCGRMARVGPYVDGAVEAAFLDFIERELGETAPEIDDTVNDSRLEEIQAELEAVRQRRRDKQISTIAAMDLIAELEAEAASLTVEKRQLSAAKAELTDTAESLLTEWEGYDTDMKRARISRDIRTVVIERTARGARFDPNLIEIVWR
ncbi:recombinase family protein [Streptomyces sp. NPDC002758]